MVAVLDDRGLEVGRSLPSKTIELAALGYFGVGSKRRIRYVRQRGPMMQCDTSDIRRADRQFRPQLPVTIALQKRLTWIPRFEHAQSGRSGLMRSVFFSSEPKTSG
jgi:hypothetical protein